MKSWNHGRRDENGNHLPNFFAHGRAAGVLITKERMPFHPLSDHGHFKRPARVQIIDDSINYLAFGAGDLGMSLEEYLDLFKPENWRQTRRGATVFGTNLHFSLLTQKTDKLMSQNGSQAKL